MSSVLASGVVIDDIETPVPSTGGAQTILSPLRAKSAYWPQAATLVVYAALLAVVALHKLTPASPPEEEAVELVMLPPPAAETPPPPVAEEPPPPVAEEPPPPVEEPPPPPVAEEPAVAPVEPKPIPKPKPPPKPLQPKPKVVEHKPVEKPRPAPVAPAPVRPAAAPPPANAVPSGYFNQVASRVARAANSHPLRGPGRVGYRIVIAPSGSVISASISSSGRPDLDAAARRAISGPFPAFGGVRPVAVSGGVRYE